MNLYSLLYMRASQDTSQIFDNWFLKPVIISTKAKQKKKQNWQFNSNGILSYSQKQILVKENLKYVLYIQVFIFRVKIYYTSRIKQDMNSTLLTR